MSLSEGTEPIPVLWDGVMAIAVNKPAGLSTTSPPGTDGLLGRLQEQFRDRTNYVTPVHRLDREVGGVLLVALTKKAARLLTEQFEARRVEKNYLAWVHGLVEPDVDQWNDWLRKVNDRAVTEVVDAAAPGAQSAETQVTVLRRDVETNRTLLQLRPVTGRMHQLRIQAAVRGHAILGDPVYGTTVADATSPEPLRLLAQQISFFSPRDGRATTVAIPPTAAWA